MDVWSYTATETNKDGRPAALVHQDVDDPLVAKILTAITNLSNHILANEASKELAKYVYLWSLGHERKHCF